MSTNSSNDAEMPTREAAVETGSVELSQQIPKLSTEKSPSENNILSLTDEALYALFSYLCTTKKGHTLRVPDQAFALAKAHPRLLRIFADLMTHVTTDEDYIGSRYILLTSSFFLEVMKAGGKALRKVRFESLGCGIFKDLAELCPNLESLTFSGKCECDACGDTLSKMLRTNIRSLRIMLPSAKTLSFIARSPPKLSLQMVHLRSVNSELLTQLDRILRDPPKELHLWVVFLFCIPSAAERLVSILRDACPNMEKLHLSIPRIPCGDPNPLDMSLEEATQLISAVRRNRIESKCRSIAISGTAAYPILEKLNPRASIELACGSVIVSDVGYGTYIKNMILPKEYMELDLSRLRAVTIDSGGCSREWKNALQDLKLKSAEVVDVPSANYLSLNVKFVTMDCNRLMNNEWEWLKNVQELHLTDPKSLDTVDADFLKGLTQAIDKFGGHAFLIIDFYMFKEIQIVAGEAFRNNLQALLAATGRFEERGGNGEMLRELVHDLQRRTSPA